MKKPASLITYVASLVIGIILLCFHGSEGLTNAIIRAMGILITVPSGLMFISFFFGKNDRTQAWYSVIVSCAGLVLGIWMLCMPQFFINVTVYTLGVILILVGAAQIAFIALASRPYGANVWWYCIPILAVAGGLIICFIGPKQTIDWAYLATGIILIVDGVNGIASLGRECRNERELRIEEKREEE